MSVDKGIKAVSLFQCNFTPFVNLSLSAIWDILKAAGDGGWADVCSSTFSLKVQPKHRQWGGFFFSLSEKTVFRQGSVQINVPFTYLFPVSRLPVRPLLCWPRRLLCRYPQQLRRAADILPGTYGWVVPETHQTCHSHPRGEPGCLGLPFSFCSKNLLAFSILLNWF